MILNLQYCTLSALFSGALYHIVTYDTCFNVHELRNYTNSFCNYHSQQTENKLIKIKTKQMQSQKLRCHSVYNKVKRLRSEAEHSPPWIAEDKNAWNNASTPKLLPSWCGAYLIIGATLPLYCSKNTIK